MAEIHSGVRSLLANPFLYDFVQAVFDGKRARANFVRNHLRIREGERILDIGCGTGNLLPHLPLVDYVGFEPNAEYVARARSKHGDRGIFFNKTFEEGDATSLPPFDVAVVFAVLHHLNDNEAKTLFALLRRSLKRTGRIATLDPVFVDGQSLVAKLLISLDRGINVRSPQDYLDLARHEFKSVAGVIEHKRCPPYTHWIMTAANIP